MRKIRLIDVIDKLEVGVIPFSVHEKRLRKVYSIKLFFYTSDRYPSYLQLEKEEYERALRHQFVPMITREMGKAIASRSGEKIKDAIQVLSLSQVGESAEDPGKDDDDEPKVKRPQKDMESGEQAEDDDDMGGEDEGADAEKRRVQETDERAYEDAEEDEDEAEEKLEGDETMQDESDSEDEDKGKNEESPKVKHSKTSEGKEVTIGSEESNKGKTPINTVQSVFDGSSFQMRFSVKHNTPHVLLSEVIKINLTLFSYFLIRHLAIVFIVSLPKCLTDC